MRFHAQTAGVSLTAQQPLNNIVRTAVEALAAVLGGTQSLHTNSYDEALALPTEQAVTVALRTQQVLAGETGVTNTVDPLGGSYFVEALTDEMERSAYEYFAKIDELGGMVEAVKRNYPQREIANAAFELQQEIDCGRTDRGGGQQLPGLRRRTRSRPCGSTRTSSASSSADCSRRARPATREAVEGSLSRLREDAAEEGRNLMDALIELRPRERHRGRDRGAPCSRSSATTPSRRSSRPALSALPRRFRDAQLLGCCCVNT